MLISIPEKHAFVPDEPPVLTFTDRGGAVYLYDLALCKMCGLGKRFECHDLCS